MNHARIVDGVVVEIIEPFFTTEEMCPPMPAEPQGEPLTDLQIAAYEEALQAHAQFVVGEVPIEQRFAPELVAQMVEAPDSVEPGWLYADGEFSPPDA
jgi:hypothetical protein